LAKRQFLMKRNTQNRQLNWKRKTSRLVALLFVLYALADVTVLQEYCGNETLGIPSYAQQIQAKNRAIDKTTDSKTAYVGSHSSQEEQTPESPASDEECFCCCSHTTLSFNPIKSLVRVIQATKQSASNFSENRLKSDSHLPQLYQPPKFA